jgi:hypothetical protein
LDLVQNSKKICESTGVYILQERGGGGGGIIFVPFAKNGEDYFYLEISVQIFIKS